jgi:hypothetical protein
MKLVEELEGVGEILASGNSIRRSRYRIKRYQGMTEGSGLPIPGRFRIEGFIEPGGLSELIDKPLALRLEDGRVLAIALADSNGRILSEGHGPAKCLCC